MHWSCQRGVFHAKARKGNLLRRCSFLDSSQYIQGLQHNLLMGPSLIICLAVTPGQINQVNFSSRSELFKSEVSFIKSCVEGKTITSFKTVRLQQTPYSSQKLLSGQIHLQRNSVALFRKEKFQCACLKPCFSVFFHVCLRNDSMQVVLKQTEKKVQIKEQLCRD